MSIATKTIALSFGHGVNAVATIVTAMVMSRVLTHVELATYRQTLLVYDFSAVILGLGLTNSIYYFLPIETKRSRGLVLDGAIVLFVMGLTSVAFLVLGGNQLLARSFSNPDLSPNLLYLSVLPVFALPSSIISAVMVTQGRVQQLTVFNLASNFLVLSSVIISCWISEKTEVIVITRVIATCLTCSAAFVVIWNSLPNDDWRPNWLNMQRLMAFGIPLGAASIFGSIQTHLDRVLVSVHCLPEEFAIYSNGALEIPLIGIITSSIAVVILPEMRCAIASGKKQAALSLFRKAAEKSAVMLVPIMVFLLVVAESLMIFLYTEKYADSAVPFRIYLLLLPARIVIYGSFMVALGLNNVVLYRTACAALCNLFMGYALVNWLGSYGAAIATVVTTYLIAVLWSLMAICRAVPCSFGEILPFRKVFGIWIISMIAIAPISVVMYLFESRYGVMEILGQGVFFACSVWFLAWVMRNDAILDAISLGRRTVNEILRKAKIS